MERAAVKSCVVLTCGCDSREYTALEHSSDLFPQGFFDPMIKQTLWLESTSSLAMLAANVEGSMVSGAAAPCGVAIPELLPSQPSIAVPDAFPRKDPEVRSNISFYPSFPELATPELSLQPNGAWRSSRLSSSDYTASLPPDTPSTSATTDIPGEESFSQSIYVSPSALHVELTEPDKPKKTGYVCPVCQKLFKN